MDSNHRPITYEATALPTELFRHGTELYRELFNRQIIISLDSSKQPSIDPYPDSTCHPSFKPPAALKGRNSLFECSNNANDRNDNNQLD